MAMRHERCPPVIYFPYMYVYIYIHLCLSGSTSIPVRICIYQIIVASAACLGNSYRIFQAVHYTAGRRRHVGDRLAAQESDWDDVSAQVVAS
jgi:hypothetical protein